MSRQTANPAMDALLETLDLERLEPRLFRGQSPQVGWQRVFGGQVVGQALVAATRTVEEENRFVHSLHAYFVRPGDPSIPIIYDAQDEPDEARMRSEGVMQEGQHGIAWDDAGRVRPESGKGIKES